MEAEVAVVEKQEEKQKEEVVIIVAVGEEKVEADETKIKRHLRWGKVFESAMTFTTAAATLALTIWLSFTIATHNQYNYAIPAAALSAFGSLILFVVWLVELRRVTSWFTITYEDD
ncbi:hypothetical protein ACH5RR_028934 [Cinchona calisaya]|uniref:Uncharacterized protein n=1 Tax=Cinchona calisaya TaxID=153742 RepID=A0ABD2YQ86_9GENT